MFDFSDRLLALMKLYFIRTRFSGVTIHRTHLLQHRRSFSEVSSYQTLDQNSNKMAISVLTELASERKQHRLDMNRMQCSVEDRGFNGESLLMIDEEDVVTTRQDLNDVNGGGQGPGNGNQRPRETTCVYDIDSGFVQ